MPSSEPSSTTDPNMPSILTPHSRSDEAGEDALHEGLMHGLLTILPTGGALYAAMQNPSFVKRTNWQSRTALVVMPALFMFTFTSEQKHLHKMREVCTVVLDIIERQ